MSSLDERPQHSPEEKALAAEARKVQRIAADNGERLTPRQAKAIVKDRQAEKAAAKFVMDALVKAAPGFTKDGQGLRGPQNPPTTIDGADGSGNNFQVSRKQTAGNSDSANFDKLIVTGCVNGQPAFWTSLVEAPPTLFPTE